MFLIRYAKLQCSITYGENIEQVEPRKLLNLKKKHIYKGVSYKTNIKTNLKFH